MKPTRDHVLTKIAHTFPNHDPAQILALLDNYDEPEHESVQLAILKLSKGNLDTLRWDVKVAKEDYRDVLSWAEYPEEICISSWRLDRSDPKLLEIRRRDREQSLAWLHSTPQPD